MVIVRKKTTISKTHIGTFISLLKIKNIKDIIAPNANEMRLLVSLKYFFKHKSHPFKKDSITKKYYIQQFSSQSFYNIRIGEAQIKVNGDIRKEVREISTIVASIIVSAITAKIVATYYFKKVDGYVKEMCEMTNKNNEEMLSIVHKLQRNSPPPEE